MIAALWTSISASPLFRNVVVIGGIVLAVLLALAGFRRKSEQTGRLVEREAHRAEAKKAEKRVEEIKKQMSDVARPDRTNVGDRLRNGDF